MSRKPKVKWVADVLAWTLLVTAMAAPAGSRADELCRLGVLQSIAVDDGWLETELRHCFCTDQITLMLNTDRTYEAAYSVELDADLGGFVGAFAERYETDPTEPGGICSFVLYLTDNGRNLRPPVDLYIWEDLEGEPGVVRGIVPNRSTGGLPVYPFFEPHPFDIVDLGQVVSINGSFWVGFATEWVEGGCSLHIGADLNGSGGVGSMVNLPNGLGFPEGWNDVDEVFGETAALGIGILYGQCPLPTHESTWGRVKSLYR